MKTADLCPSKIESTEENNSKAINETVSICHTEIVLPTVVVAAAVAVVATAVTVAHYRH